MKTIVWAEEVNKTSIPQVGGKGANLGEMLNAKMPVPQAFIVTAEAFDHFVTSVGIKDDIMDLLSKVKVDNEKSLSSTSKSVREVVRGAKVPWNLEVDIDKMGELHRLSRDKNLSVNSTCAVFAESEIISLLAEGHKKEEIVSGIHVSIAKRIVRLAGRITIQDDVLFDGGTAYNVGLIDALEDEFMRDLHIPESPQITTAIGAANMALDIFSKSLTQSSISENRDIIT